MIDNFLSVHANSLKLRAQRTEVLASNIANADTPNYKARDLVFAEVLHETCLLYTSPSPRDKRQSRMPSSA